MYKHVRRFQRPAQRGNRVTPGVGRDELLELEEQVRVLVDVGLAAATLTPNPAGGDGIHVVRLHRAS